MRYLKTPVSKRSDPTIPWRQEGFTNIYRDIPASEIPKGGVSDAINVLLYGDRAVVRSGDEIHASIALPTDSDQPLSSGIAKSGTSVTHSGNGFTSDMVGKYLIWNDNTSSLIVDFVSTGEVTVDDSTAQSDTDVTIRSQVWGNIWHEKSKKIFLHIGTRLFHTPWNFSGGWVEITLPKGSTLTQTRSKFDKEEDLLYLFNGNGTFLIDATDTSNISAVQINMASPANTITPMTDEKTFSDTASPYPPTATEIDNGHNRFGRRYIYSLLRLDGNQDNDRGDGTRIVKESGTNLANAANDYKDFKESWRIHNFDKADIQPQARIYSVGELDVRASTSHVLANFLSQQVGVIGVTIESQTRDVTLDFEGLTTWDEIAFSIGESIRAVFTEYPALHCTYKNTGYLIIATGDPTVDFEDVVSPSSGFDFTASGFFDTYADVQIPSWRAIGTRATGALKVPSGQYGYTHFGIYSTRTLGPDSRVGNNNVVNPEYFIWQKDVPIIKPMHSMSQGNGVFYSYNGRFAKEDLGSYVANVGGTKEQFIYQEVGNATKVGNVYNDGASFYNDVVSSGSNDSTASNKLINSGATFVTDGVTAGMLVVTNLVLAPSTRKFARVISVDSETQLTLDADIFTSTFITYNVGGGPTAIGSDEPMLCTKSGTTVTKVVPASGTFDFEDADVGKTIFWADGTFDIIKSVTNATTLETVESSNKSVNVAMAFEPSDRNYNDTLTDQTLTDRATAFPVLNRFFDALPNSDIGAVAPGFTVVASEDGTKGYYSQYSDSSRYLSGHHYAEFQQFIMTDLIKEIQAIPNQLIVWCKNSTWRFQTNVVDSVQDARVGESIGILSGKGNVDENIGISDRMGVVSYGNGMKMVVTSEPGIRLFDGYRYGENKLMDEFGRGMVKSDFQIMKDRVVGYYEPNMYGMMFWGSTLTHTDESGLPLLSKSNKSFRMAVESQHGFGFSELDGSKWNYIELNSKPMLITDDQGNKITILFDTNLGYPHRLSTRKLPSLTSSSGIELNHKDNEDVGGGNGTEITWSMTLREHLAPEEQWKLRNQESYWYLRPYNEANKNQTGYDVYGFRSAQRLTFEVFTDGNDTAVSVANTVDPKATIFQPYKVEDRRVKVKISGTASELIITGTRELYDVLKRRQPPGSQDETLHQDTLSQFIYRISRGYQKVRNLYNGEDDLQSSRFYEYQGPDGKSGSAFCPFSDSDFVEHNAPAVSGGGFARTLFFSFRSSGSHAVTLYDEYTDASNSKLKVHFNGTGIEVSYAGSLKATIAIDNSTWYTFRVRLGGVNLTIDYMKSDLIQVSQTIGSVFPTALLTTDKIRIAQDTQSTGHRIFDVILFSGEISDDEVFKYYARDIYKFGGFSLLPHIETGLGEIQT